MVLMQGFPSRRSFDPAHLTNTSIVADGECSRKARTIGVAKRLSPMPAKEITRIFISELFAIAHGSCRIFFSSLSTRLPGQTQELRLAPLMTGGQGWIANAEMIQQGITMKRTFNAVIKQ